MTIVNIENPFDGDGIAIEANTDTTNTFAELAEPELISTEHDRAGQQLAQVSENTVAQMGAETLEHIGGLEQEVDGEIHTDQAETKAGILRRLDTAIRGRELQMDERILSVLIALSIGTVTIIGDNIAMFEKVPVVGWIAEWASDQGLHWVANKMDELMRELASKVRNKDYRTEKPFIHGTAKAVAAGLGLGSKLLVNIGFIPAGVIGDFINPGSIQSGLELGKYLPIAGAFVERGVSITDWFTEGVIKIIEKVTGRNESDQPRQSFIDWLNEKISSGATFAPATAS